MADQQSAPRPDERPTPDQVAPEPATDVSEAAGPDRRPWTSHLERLESVMLLGGVASLALSFIALGLLPILEMQQQVEETTPETFQAMSDEEALGFEVYKREGCMYCHSMFVRTTDADTSRFGHPAEAWEFQEQYPQQWGTRRIGPDLSRVGGQYSDDWHLAHLFDPRSTVPDSVMPAYPWLFTEDEAGDVHPTREGEALVAYLQSLGRNMSEAGPQVPETDHGGHR